MKRFVVLLLLMSLCMGGLPAHASDVYVQGGVSVFDFLGNSDIKAFADNFYEDLPDSFSVRAQWDESFEKTVTDEQTIAKAFEALKELIVSGVPYEAESKIKTQISFCYDDGREFHFNFLDADLDIGSSAIFTWGGERLFSLLYALKGGTPFFDFYDDPEITAFADSFYDDMPDHVEFFFAWFGPGRAVLTEKEEIAYTFETLKQIVVPGDLGGIMTDSDTTISFVYDDGRIYSFKFMSPYLEIRDGNGYNTYELANNVDLYRLIHDLYD